MTNNRLSRTRFYNLLDDLRWVSVTSFVRSGVSVIIKCNNGHFFKIRPDNIIEQKSCGLCKLLNPITESDFSKLVKSKDSAMSYYVDGDTKVWVLCEFNHIFEIRPNYAIYSNRWCKECTKS